MNGVNGPGFEVQSSPIVLINALGFVGFKLIGVAGSREVRIQVQPVTICRSICGVWSVILMLTLFPPSSQYSGTTGGTVWQLA